MTERKNCFHEAGHAIAAAVLGSEVSSATVVPDDDYGGLVTHKPPSFIPAQIAISLAGVLAEMWSERADSPDPHCASDFAKIDAVIAKHSDVVAPRQSFEEYGFAEALAKATLLRYWGAVAATAAWLAEHGTTASGELIHAIVREYDLKLRDYHENNRASASG